TSSGALSARSGWPVVPTTSSTIGRRCWAAWGWSGFSWPSGSAGISRDSSGRSWSASTPYRTTRLSSMSAGSDALIPGLPLTREQALALPGMRRYRLVEFLIRWEHFGAARELLESLVDGRAGRFFYQYRLAQCYLATGDVEQARRV